MSNHVRRIKRQSSVILQPSQLLTPRDMELTAKTAVAQVEYWRRQGFEHLTCFALPRELMIEVLPRLLLDGWHLGAAGEAMQWFTGTIFAAVYPGHSEARLMDEIRMHGVLHAATAVAYGALQPENVEPEVSFRFEEDVDVARAEPARYVKIRVVLTKAGPAGAVSVDGEEPAPARVAVEHAIRVGRVVATMRQAEDALSKTEELGWRIGIATARLALEKAGHSVPEHLASASAPSSDSAA